MSRSVFTTAVLCAVLLVASACAQESSSNPFAVASDRTDQPETPDDLDAVVEAALEDVEAFWSETYPEVYGDRFEPVADLHPYGPDTGPVPCGRPPLSYEEVQDNAFYCPDADMVAWDEASLIPALAEQFGRFVVGIVFAHEYGHAIQAPSRADVRNVDTIVTELQADCFSGAWTAWIAAGNSDDFRVGIDELNSSVAGMLEISDLPGTSASDPWAHGSGFDRVGAFQDGYQNGAGRCAEYPDVDLAVVEIEFGSTDEQATGGNMPLDELVPLLERNLNLYHRLLLEERFGSGWEPVELLIADPRREEVTCDGERFSGEDLEMASGYCAEESTVVFSADLAEALFEEHGDFAVGAEITRLYAEAVQDQLELRSTSVKEANLQRDCLVGVHAAANFPDERDSSIFADAAAEALGSDENLNDYILYLSPGDLDEALRGFFTFDETATDEMGTVFERAGAIRDGFDGGLESCSRYGALD